MTSVREAVGNGAGEVLANFREIPTICRPLAEKTVADMNKAGFKGIVVMGEMSEPVCEIPVGVNKNGIVLLGGLNPVAAAEEAGIEADNLAMSTVMEYQDLVNFHDAVIDYRDLVRFWQVSV
jgi:repressor of nif and glnA expression